MISLARVWSSLFFLARPMNGAKRDASIRSAPTLEARIARRRTTNVQRVAIVNRLSRDVDLSMTSLPLRKGGERSRARTFRADLRPEHAFAE